MSEKLRFSKQDRAAIGRQVIGKPTETIVEIGGFSLALVPITTEQADEIFTILESFGKLSLASKGGVAEVSQDFLASMIPTEGRRIRRVLRSILFDSAKANDLVDDDSVEIFDEWFGKLPLLETVRTMLPKIVEAQGLGTMLGNSSTPPPEPASAPSTTGS